MTSARGYIPSWRPAANSVGAAMPAISGARASRPISAELDRSPCAAEARPSERRDATARQRHAKVLTLRGAMPRPRLHLIWHHGVLAPNARLRPLVVPQKPEVQERAAEVAVAGGCDVQTVQSRPRRLSWARLLKRVFDIDMQHCPNCGGGELKIIAAILERPVIEKILSHLGLDPQPPPRGRVRQAGQDFAT